MSMTPAEMREHLMGALDINEGEPIHRRMPGTEGYEMAARCLGKALLLVCEDDPSLLDIPADKDGARGIGAAFHDAHWGAAKARWPGINDWLGGVTGFQFGWANNAVRYALGTRTVGNPAILTVGS